MLLVFFYLLVEDDWVDGMYLFKGSDIFINVFGMYMDEKRFFNFDVFNLDNYEGYMVLVLELVGGDYNNWDYYGYGSGRRICFGIYLVERNLFLVVVKLVWVFNIGFGLDVFGREILLDVSYEIGYCLGFLVCVEDFLVIIILRLEV